MSLIEFVQSRIAQGRMVPTSLSRANRQEQPGIRPWIAGKLARRTHDPASHLNTIARHVRRNP